MDAGNIKRQALYVVIGVLGCVLVWKIAPLLRTSGLVNRVPATGANMTQGPHAPPGSVLVNVTMVGFDPELIEAKAGQPLKLAFFRPNAANCAREVVFPDLGIRKELPPGQTVVVDITPQKSGPLGFECGMKMLKGQLIVR
ncbi:MAG TPA: cupredoxin domain-containing protein [Bryobacteraceae bacterium]|nr:cupredoxin domain-containing protein [Bryobacteraceae bacterium]HXJ37956.1 cupredoxin domain-containing protein [Bryobacteraceae bacterium]